MNTTSGSSNDDDPQHAMREALQRDAAQAKDAPFDAGLHHTAMRRIRALAEKKTPPIRWGWIAATAGTCAFVTLSAILLSRGSAPKESHRKWAIVPDEHGFPTLMIYTIEHMEVPTDPDPGTGTASVWTYATAARQGDEALLAMLDRDAQRLLPPTASAFSTPLN